MRAGQMVRYVAAIGFAMCAGLPSALAGGPLVVCSNTPTKYPGAGPVSVTLNYDLGPLGSRTKAQADTLVTDAVSVWNVGTSTMTLARGSDLPVDVTSSNYLTYIETAGTSNDGLNPVIYDTNGSIIDAIFGSGAKSQVLGFAGSGHRIYADHCEYSEGRAVISGYLSVGDTTMKVVMAHEVGHLIGMDHTQLDSHQGLSPNSPSNYPLMYPIAYRGFVNLHEDDVAAVSALYPNSNTLNGVYGQLTGTFTQANGTPIRGANLWVRENTTLKVYSIVSDYLIQNTGYFKLLLPAGTYTLHAEAIHTGFTSGSSVGPYSDTSADASFQSPLYVSGVAMSPLTLGNGTPAQIEITAGCAATAVFKFDGTGSIGGNCAAVSPPGAPTINGITSGNGTATVTFTAPASNGGSAVTSYTATCVAAGQTTRTNSGAGSPITVSVLTGGVTYSCSVTASNSSGTGPASATLTATPVTPPSAPAITSIAIGNGSATINFTAPSSNGGGTITGYTVTCSAAGQATRTNTGSNSPITVLGLNGGISYSCSVTASNGVGASSSSASLLVTPNAAINIAPIWMLLSE